MGDILKYNILSPRICFNPRPRTVGDCSMCAPYPVAGSFQPTPTHGGRLEVRAFRGTLNAVSTHAHARWATLHGCLGWEAETVSTHAHARWATALAVDALMPVVVSTHAHARWATLSDEMTTTWRIVSTHAHARWATRPPAHRSLDSSRFNPRPRTVGDVTASNSTMPLSPVSTHAHARWATWP